MICSGCQYYKQVNVETGWNDLIFRKICGLNLNPYLDHCNFVEPKGVTKK